MANTKAILSQIMTESGLKDLITKSDGENVTVIYNGEKQTLSSALAKLLAATNLAVTADSAKSLIAEEIAKLVDGAPEAGDTLKELFDLISNNKEAAELLNSAITNKVDKEEGKGLSAEDFTTILKNKLDALPEIGSDDVSRWNGIRGVRVGSEVPENLKVGELFVQLINEA